MKSIIGEQTECYVCGRIGPLETHHIFFGNNRKNSEKYGMKAKLCSYCHRSEKGIHGRDGHELDLRLKQEFQSIFEMVYKGEDFMKIFGRNYL